MQAQMQGLAIVKREIKYRILPNVNLPHCEVLLMKITSEINFMLDIILYITKDRFCY